MDAKAILVINYEINQPPICTPRFYVFENKDKETIDYPLPYDQELRH